MFSSDIFNDSFNDSTMAGSLLTPVKKTSPCSTALQRLRGLKMPSFSPGFSPCGATEDGSAFRPRAFSFTGLRDVTDSLPKRKLNAASEDHQRLKRRRLFKHKSFPAPEADLDDEIEEQRLKNHTSEADIKVALEALEDDATLIGDSSRAHALPLTSSSKHQDLANISHDTLAAVLRGDYDDVIDSCTVIDCRYPYEFEGGHIEGAINIHTQAQCEEKFLRQAAAPSSTKRNILVFHCEFSSERGPRMLRHLRAQDRTANAEQYPALNYPEIYLLKDGYKSFYENQIERCEPQTYRPMLHEDFTQELKKHRGSGSNKNKRAMPRRGLRL